MPRAPTVRLERIPGCDLGFADPWKDDIAKRYTKRFGGLSKNFTVCTFDGQTFQREMLPVPQGWLCIKTGSVFNPDGYAQTTNQVWLQGIADGSLAIRHNAAEDDLEGELVDDAA